MPLHFRCSMEGGMPRSSCPVSSVLSPSGKVQYVVSHLSSSPPPSPPLSPSLPPSSPLPPLSLPSPSSPLPSLSLPLPPSPPSPLPSLSLLSLPLSPSLSLPLSLPQELRKWYNFSTDQALEPCNHLHYYYQQLISATQKKDTFKA